jgi:outer membrane receptor protein involved in Fe transport
MKIISTLITLLILLSFSAGAFAQTPEERAGALDGQQKLIAEVDAAPEATDQIQGMIKDVLGKPVSGASLVLKSPDGTIIGRTKSDADGHFVFSRVAPPGNYAVLAEKTGFQASTSIVTLEAGTIAATTLTMAAQEAPEISVIAERLVRARNGLSPTTGGSVYHFDQEDIQNLPEGANTTFNQLLLQAPGVVNDSYKQFHIRGDEGNVQYRINGIMLPEGITTGFGPIFDSRFFNRVDLETGGLPAQFGFHTAGVVAIETKTGEQGGSVEVYGGSHDEVKPTFELGGSQGNMTYYLNGSFLSDNLGIENPTSKPNAIHDHTNQDTGFGYVSWLLNSTTKFSLILGTYEGFFQIPTLSGQTPDPFNQGFLSALGITGYDSASVNNRQYETNSFGIAALQSSIGPDFDYQLAFISRLNTAHFAPDIIGDLAFYGVASDIHRGAISNALQADSSYRLNDAHTVRLGFFGQDENISSDNTSTVFPLNPLTGNVDGQPYQIVDNNPKNGNVLWGAYLQDEWKPIDKLTVNYGLRYDELHSYTKGDQLSPRLGLVYNATPETTLHAAYARYFTPPQTEMVSPKTIAVFANTPNEPAVTQSSPVLPERSHYFDLGVVQKVTPELNIGLDSYYKIVRDMLDEAQFGPALIFSDLNYDKGYIYGVELTGNYKSGNFGAYTNFAYNIAKATDIVSGQWSWPPINGQSQLAYIANHWIYLDHDQIYTASSGINYNLSGTMLSADATFGSGLRTGFANEQKLPNNVQLNLGVRRKFQLLDLGPFVARIAIINVTDNKNVIRDSGGGVFAPQYGPRIGFYAGLTKLF